MQVTLADSAGFCFGVDRAVELVYRLLDEGHRVCTLGPIIHNPQLVAALQERGVVIAETAEEIPEGYTVVIRSHGIAKDELEAVQGNGREICNATCPFVSKIHRIVEQKGRADGLVLIAGDAAHPEVQGIRSYCPGASRVFRDEPELDAILGDPAIREYQDILCVAQTTFSLNIWKKSIEKLKKVCTNAVIFDTICGATSERQSEAVELSKRSDAMIVIGGRHSSNTAKLRDVSAAHCDTFLIETARELRGIDLSRYQSVGVTAGASTPAGIIKEVLQTMSEIKETNTEKEVETTAAQSPEVAETAESADTAANEPAASASADGEMSFAELLEESFKSVTTDQKVRGKVVRITPTEVQVDVDGRKQAGFVTLDELTANPNEKVEDIVQVGDELDLIIMKTNDQDGTIMLSKRRLDAIKGWENVVAAHENDEVMEGVVSAVVRGGVLVSTHGVRVFVPASLATLNRGENLENLLNQEVRFKIIEINESRRRAVASIKAVLREERKATEDAFWSQLEEEQKYTGTVKSLTSYGAFVDIGGVDGMIHISELSWNRIKHPSEVVNVGDTVEVYIKGLDHENRKISLGFKKLEDNLWEVLRRDYPIGTVVKAKIVGLTTFGAFANIIPGIDGLIHISQIANQHVKNPADLLKVGQEVDAVITEINFEGKRVSLSMRKLLEDEAPAAEEEAPVQEENAVFYSTDDHPAAEAVPAEKPAEESAPAEETVQAPAEEPAPAEADGEEVSTEADAPAEE
ncbi:MAG: bifunctional 4-hydroxy-3-methylbut-2-enyl diphosphate reductase/30S ribosomal protein S1 [Clostridiales bacterium]|nr:bifunctional 4-hydroxy-3-methylbut-2-enyl diphosphate reductase/30S ribosomal protein S1 [Clostridiales bacterium]